MTAIISTPEQASDARQAPRVNVSWGARIVLTPETFLEARIVNVSADGLGLVCEKAFQTGTVLHVLIALPDPVNRSHYHYPALHSKVVFQVIKGSKFRIGTRFARLEPAVKAMIETWVQRG